MKKYPVTRALFKAIGDSLQVSVPELLSSRLGYVMHEASRNLRLVYCWTNFNQRKCLSMVFVLVVYISWSNSILCAWLFFYGERRDRQADPTVAARLISSCLMLASSGLMGTNRSFHSLVCIIQYFFAGKGGEFFQQWLYMILWNFIECVLHFCGFQNMYALDFSCRYWECIIHVWR